MHARRSKLENFFPLKKRADFIRVTKLGRRWVGQSLILQFLPVAGNSIFAGYTVSKKVDKSAVRRNRLRRRLKSLAKDVLPEQACPGIYVLIGRKAAFSSSYNDLVRELEWCLKRMGCLKDE